MSVGVTALVVLLALVAWRARGMFARQGASAATMRFRVLIAVALGAAEQAAGPIFYRPNIFVGLAVFGLLVVRIGYRLAQVLPVVAAGGRPALSLASLSDPFTAASFVLVAAYVASYGVLLLATGRT